MKTLQIIFYVGLLCLSLPSLVFAQAKSEARYWVVESNVYDPNNYCVRLYDVNNYLVCEVKMNDVKIDITKKRHRIKLDRMLADFNRNQTLARSVKKYRIKSA